MRCGTLQSGLEPLKHARVECRAPRGWAESFVIFSSKSATDFLAAGQTYLRRSTRRSADVRRHAVDGGMAASQGRGRCEVGRRCGKELI